MLAAVQGYYNGNQIVLEESVPLAYGQRVIVTILEEKPEKKPPEFSKYRVGKEHNLPMDAQDYVKELREDREWADFLECLNGFSDDFMQNGREEFAFTARDDL